MVDKVLLTRCLIYAPIHLLARDVALMSAYVISTRRDVGGYGTIPLVCVRLKIRSARNVEQY
ncbi:hypothetical protein A9Q96_12410 [Rhodobacterales bacterium 52_120_T64]|nr:hypothetical protein A9Q96_12410 [Rhodobacterales bacterium 52_120_T64]